MDQLVTLVTTYTPLQESDLPLLLLPVIGAFIGYLTNYVAVKMLFHPKRPIPLLFFTLQGVFPKRQAAFAHKLGSIVSTELFSVAEVTERLKEEAGSEHTKKVINEYLYEVITQRLPESVPMIAMVLTPELVQVVQQAFMSEFEAFVGKLIEELSGTLERELDVHTIVEEKVANFSSDKLEEILFAIMKREFRFIEFVGGVLGFVIGIAQIVFLIATTS